MFTQGTTLLCPFCALLTTTGYKTEVFLSSPLHYLSIKNLSQTEVLKVGEAYLGGSKNFWPNLRKKY